MLYFINRKLLFENLFMTISVKPIPGRLCALWQFWHLTTIVCSPRDSVRVIRFHCSFNIKEGIKIPSTTRMFPIESEDKR